MNQLHPQQQVTAEAVRVMEEVKVEVVNAKEVVVKGKGGGGGYNGGSGNGKGRWYGRGDTVEVEEEVVAIMEEEDEDMVERMPNTTVMEDVLDIHPVSYTHLTLPTE